MGGYAYEAACEILRCAFDIYDILPSADEAQIWARVSRFNRSAIKLVERLGMTPQSPMQNTELRYVLFKITRQQFWRSCPAGRLYD